MGTGRGRECGAGGGGNILRNRQRSGGGGDGEEENIITFSGIFSPFTIDEDYSFVFV